jgi:hypothetical protein
MFLELLALAGQRAGLPPIVPAPSLGTVSISSAPGQCPGTDATVTMIWSITNPDDANYETRIYRDGVLDGVIANTGTTYTKTQAGYVESSEDLGSLFVDWHFRVDVVRLSDGGQIGTQTAPTISRTYKTCLAQ